MNRRFDVPMIIWILCFSLFGLLSMSAFAEQGEGDGGGGGPVVPLRMDWSYPANKEGNVSVTPIMQCKYSHNVAQSNVISRNETLFSLEKLDGTKVDVEVYAADSQIEFDKRQNIYIEPKKPLEYSTTYVLTAKEGIQAKNGMVTAKDDSFQFTTQGRRQDFNASNVTTMVANDIALSDDVGDNDATKDSILQESNVSMQSQVQQQETEMIPQENAVTETKETKDQAIMLDHSAILFYIAVGFVFFASIFVSLMIRRRQER